MSIQTKPGAPSLDSSDFQLSYSGVRVGVELRHVATPDGESVSSALMCELMPDGSWGYKATLAQDFIGDIKSAGGAMNWLRDTLIPKINAWLSARFAAGGPPPDPVDAPPELIALDGLMGKLKVTVVAGVPQVSL